MRLSKIKLAGFKSFVDPTVLNLPSNLVGIVGPNGCGKSNTIDAVRWVMGESSAKHLRGESMEDVIFNGSATRKPVSQASIELIFDNSDGSLGGEYARFNEIAIRRQVTREGQSTYFLNGTRCRRRDITDIFLGTGLGPRSYAIIEQGMISRLIEAKPQELRVYLEEAAGISKYKERRKETENRMRHTRENLDRLNDLREEIGKQLEHLKRQAETAERFKQLKAEERRCKAELLALRLQQLQEDLGFRQRAIAEKQTALEQLMAKVRETEAKIETLRSERDSANEHVNAQQAGFYQLGSEISQIEQTIRHQQELQERQLKERQTVLRELEQAQEELAQDAARLQEQEQELAQLESELFQQEEILETAQQALEEAEQAQAAWQRDWEQANQAAAQPLQVAQVEKARMEQLERQIQRVIERRERLDADLQRLDMGPLMSQIDSLGAEEQLQELRHQEAEAALEQTQTSIDALREGLREYRAQLDREQRNTQQLKGRLASLEALQQAALGKDQASVQRWLDAHQMTTATRLGERIEARPEWTAAVERVLGQLLEGVEVTALGDYLSELDTDSPNLVEATALATMQDSLTLWGQVVAPESVKDLLSSVLIAQDLAAAERMRPQLTAQQSIITQEGFWMGRHWVKAPEKQDAHAGLLARKQEIDRLQAQLETAEQQITELTAALETRQAQLQQLEQTRKEQQTRANTAHRAWTEAHSKVAQARVRLEQFEQRQTAMTEEIEEFAAQLVEESAALERATQRRNEALQQLEGLQARQHTLEAQRDTHQQRLREMRSQVEQKRSSVQASKLRQESLRASTQGLRQNLLRVQERVQHLETRLKALVEALPTDQDPIAELQARLEQLLSARVTQEAQLAQARDALQVIDQRIREFEQNRHTHEQRANDLRAELEQMKLASQEIQVRGQTLTEQLQETEFEFAALLEALEANATVAAWEERLEQLSRRIARLGAINLAAIDEYQEQSERKVYLDSQHADLMAALDTLEDAIRKIDRETRERFKQTFDAVNTKIQEKFPKLFGGGHAHLELTEDDLLTTGVAIMARPPGKRITNIHLMSGGEKALTAVAMVFSIFELNPSPFCMLDEVDAPLDDANVGRFCDLVEAMSERVQFIFITHNKATMELSQQLIGVTMREPGVSRIVDVNVDEAAIMANG